MNRKNKPQKQTDMKPTTKTNITIALTSTAALAAMFLNSMELRGAAAAIGASLAIMAFLGCFALDRKRR